MIMIAYLAFVAVTFPLLFGRDRLIGIIYALLFVYSFFALLGYLYMPGYSETLNAYFGDTVGRIGVNFVFASMALIFLLNMAIYRRAVSTDQTALKGIPVVIGGNRLGPLILWSLLATFTGWTTYNFNDLTWYIAELDVVPLQLSLYLLLFKLSSGIIILFYTIIRLNLIPGYRHFILPISMYTIVFLVAATKLGNRTDPAALIVGALYFESARKKLEFKTIAATFLLVAFAASLLTVVEMTRYDGSYVQMTLSERIIKNDYFAPAHVMLGAIAFDYIDPREVIESNFANALVKMQHAFLQKPVMDLFAPGVASRSASYAFYVFTEGYMFMGLLGFAYNALVVTFFVKIWNLLGCTKDVRINLAIRSILSTMAINVVRGQSCYFIKYLYTFFLPVMLVGIVVMGLRVAPRLRKVSA